MSEEPVTPEIGRFSKHKFIVLIAASIILALILTVVSMTLYGWSGAAQVDLSRPGYQSVQKKANSSEKYEGFSATGEISNKVLDEFNTMYDKQSKKVVGVDAFGGNVLDDTTLKIDDPALQPETNQ